jgi:hypothetical protein
MWYYLYAGFCLLGLLLFGIAIWQYQQTTKLLSTGIKTQSEVIDLLESKNEDGDTMYKAVFQFTTREGNVVSFKSNVRARPATHKIGQIVPVIYNSSDFEDVRIIGFWGLYRGTIILLSLGSPLLIIGGGYLLYLKGLL